MVNCKGKMDKKSTKLIKYILWDVDGTLLDFELAESEAIRECFKDFNLGNCSNKQLEDYKNINTKYWKLLEDGKLSKKEVLERRFVEFFSKYGIDPIIASDFNEAYQICIGNIAHYMENAKDTVIALKEKYKQYGVTNGTIVAQEIKLAKSALDRLLEYTFISERIGFNKPSIHYFNKVFEKVGSNNPEEYIIIGDSLTSDMQGGINAGIMTCWFNPYKKRNDKDLKLDYEIKDLKEVINILSKSE